MIQTPRTHLLVRSAVLVAVDLAALWTAWHFATNSRLGTYWGAEFRLHNSTTFFVNGAVLLESGEHTGALPGQVLRGPLYQANR